MYANLSAGAALVLAVQIHAQSAERKPAPAPAPSSQTVEPLTFSLGPVKRWATPGVVTIGFSLRNTGRTAQYVAQHPGASTWISCLTNSGGGIGGGPGVSSRGDLAREYYLRLEPGDALLGEVTVVVPAECRETIGVHAEFRADDDRKWGTGARALRLAAAPFELRRPPRPGRY